MRFFHGSSTAVVADDEYRLLPPSVTGRLQEEGRRRRLDRVFATPDVGLAKIYAGRARQRFGGRPIILEVIVADDDFEYDGGSRPGATVVVASGAWIARRL